ncbi:DNA topoisomerase 3 [Paenibacillus periandrae]|uniref:DNA topoisomerase 3 n=1 Tax=Paenibacillus periandrae TaxID=1761741 RepID=UPI001F0951ED|nr:DNA topoisomerase 3 [Paenibacillus periandrae]
MKVVLAEKKIQAEELAKPFPHKSAQGYIELLPCATFPKGGFVVWASGHLIGLSEPEEYDPKYEKWNIQDLPIVPQNFKHKVDRAKSGLYTTIKRLVTDPRVSEVILSTDPGREGELIGGLILRHAGNKKPVKRLWTSSLAKTAVVKAFNNLLPESAKKNLYYEAYSRQCADWLVGMNTSRLYSILLQSKGVKADGSFSTGRVQTPLLALIVERDIAIENFVSKPFWQVYADFEVNGKRYRGQWFKDAMTNLPVMKLSNDLILACQGKQADIRDVKKEQKQYAPPLLHNLSSLQTLVNKRLRYSPQDVLDIVQGLYERGVVSYPRSDSQYVTEDEAITFPSILEKLSHIIEFSALLPTPVQSLIGNKQYVNPEMVSDHYAIIPTEDVPNLSDLDERERNVYDLIARSLIAAHYPKAIFDFTTVITYIDGKFSFISKGKVTIQEGWRKVLFPNGLKEDDESEDSDEQTLPVLVSGEQGIAITCTSKEGKTQPPKRYTEGNLISLMKSAGKSVDDKEIEKILQSTDGLGTEATRSGMIGRLKQQKYIEVKKNMVYSTNKGRILIQAIGNSILASAEMTGKWEKRLRQVGDGSIKYMEFIEEAKALTLQLVQEGYASVQNMTPVTIPSESPVSGVPVQSETKSYHQSNHTVPLVQHTSSHQAAPSTPGPSHQFRDKGSDITKRTSMPNLGSQAPQLSSTPIPSSRKEFTSLDDELYHKALWEVVHAKQASVSLLQRRLTVGYTVCAKLIDRMELEGFISPYKGNEPRKVLMDIEELQRRYPRNNTSPSVQIAQTVSIHSEQNAQMKPAVPAQSTTQLKGPEASKEKQTIGDIIEPSFAPLTRSQPLQVEKQKNHAGGIEPSPGASQSYENPRTPYPPSVESTNTSETYQTPQQNLRQPVSHPSEPEPPGKSTKSPMQQRGTLNMHDLGYCPKCRIALVMDKGKFYGCSAYKETQCDFTIGKQILGVEVTKEDVQSLLNKGETLVKKGFKSKNTDDFFDAAIVMKADGRIEFKSPEARALKLPTSLLRMQSNHKEAVNNSQEIEWIELATSMIKMPAKVKKVSHGPKVIRYELLPESMKINISNYRRYRDNFQAALQAEKITLYSPIPGSNHVGIEVPNKNPYVIHLRGMLENREFLINRDALSFPIGVDMIGKPVIADLAKMPHLLIAGATGSGKSVFLNALIISLVYGLDPDELRLILIDPKKVELSAYSKLPHLFCPIIIDPQRSVSALKSLVAEMDKRYDIFLKEGVKNIQSYNESLLKKDPRAAKLPYIVLVIDELADLMMTASDDVETQIQRLSQLSRAAGIHMVIATQRPTKQFLSTAIKGNLPTRLAFAVASGNDSLVILDEPGAEDLLGGGDMFFKPKDGPKQRLVSAYVSDEEIESVVSFITQKYS